jgi:hypothetical protein
MRSAESVLFELTVWRGFQSCFLVGFMWPQDTKEMLRG